MPPAADRVVPGPESDAAASALEAARLAGAQVGAPLTLSLAEGSYAEALLESRRQAGMPSFLRDYASTRTHMIRTLEYAKVALAVATSAAERQRTRAEGELAEARRVIDEMELAAALVRLPASALADLRAARELAGQARVLTDGRAYREALDRSREALGRAHAVRVALRHEASRFLDPARVADWRAWVEETIAWSRETGKAAVVVDKDGHRVVLYERGRATLDFHGELGWNNMPDKLHQGDGATPEGRYRITVKKDRGQSRYYRALLIDYPNAQDRAELAEAKRGGSVLERLGAGGLIEIHGQGGQGRDWTDGCVAVTNEEMDRLFSRVVVGTPVTIVGSYYGEGVFSSLARSLGR